MGCKKCEAATVSDSQRQVLEALAKAKEPWGSKEISGVIDMESKQISCQLTALKKKGYVDSPVRCKYAITTDGKKALA